MNEVYEMNIDEIEKYIIGKKIKDMSLEEIKKFIETQGNTIILNHHVLENQQQELDKYKNIVDELEKDILDYFKKEYPNRKIEDYNLKNCTYDYALVILDKLKELKERNKIDE